jgi:hypothetical protein
MKFRATNVKKMTVKISSFIKKNLQYFTMYASHPVKNHMPDKLMTNGKPFT